jgi:hypothetical protein
MAALVSLRPTRGRNRPGQQRFRQPCPQPFLVMTSGSAYVCASFISLTPFRPLETEMRIAKNLVSGEIGVRGRAKTGPDQPQQRDYSLGSHCTQSP